MDIARQIHPETAHPDSGTQEGVPLATREVQVAPDASFSRRMLDGFYAACFAVSMAALVLVAVVVLLQIAGRLTGVNVPAVPEIAAFAMATSSFLALAHTLHEGGHVRVSMLVGNLAGRKRLVVEGVVLGMALLLTLLFSFYLIRMTIESFESGEASSGVIAIPLWIPQTLVCVGVVALLIALADLQVSILRGRAPGYIDKEELAH